MKILLFLILPALLSTQSEGKVSIISNMVHAKSYNASTAILLPNSHILIAEDERNQICDYPLVSGAKGQVLLDLDAVLDTHKKELDLEASCQSFDGKIVYWMGSHGNNKEGKRRSGREKLIATQLTQKDDGFSLKFLWSFDDLRDALVDWGEEHALAFRQATREGVPPKSKDGFNIEGLELSPSGKDLWIGFRSPLIEGKYALIAPWKSFVHGTQKPTQVDLGSPIILDLQGRGIRSLYRTVKGDYIISAGSVDRHEDFALFIWDGILGHAPQKMGANLQGLAPEGIVDAQYQQGRLTQVLLLSDWGENQESASQWVMVSY